MTGWLIVNEFLRNKKFNELYERFQQEAEYQNIDLKSMTNTSVLAALSLAKSPKPDFVLFWDKDVLLAEFLENMEIRVYNSSHAITLCDNKAKTYITLMKEKISVPKTIIAPMTYENIGYTNLDFIKNIEDEFSYPLVIKESFGSFGQQVYLVKNKDELIKKTKELQGKSFLYQQYIQSSHGKDIRLQVVGDQVIAAMFRTSDTDFRANVSNGGKMQPYKPTEEQRELAIKACRATGTHFAGVDMLFGENGKMFVCEINSNAHFINLEECTQVNVAGAILRHLRCLRNCR